MYSIFQLNVGGAKRGDGRMLEFICSCPTREEAEDQLPSLGEGFYYILPCYEIKGKKDV